MHHHVGISVALCSLLVARAQYSIRNFHWVLKWHFWMVFRCRSCTRILYNASINQHHFYLMWSQCKNVYMMEIIAVNTFYGVFVMSATMEMYLNTIRLQFTLTYFPFSVSPTSNWSLVSLCFAHSIDRWLLWGHR